jgi:hypothetical protein
MWALWWRATGVACGAPAQPVLRLSCSWGVNGGDKLERREGVELDNRGRTMASLYMGS